jgi:hypothetical protein
MLRTDTPNVHSTTFSRRRQQSSRKTNRKRTSSQSSPPVEYKRFKSTDIESENLLATLEQLKAESAEQNKRFQQLKCVELLGVLVDFFADQIIAPELPRRHGNWYYNVRNKLQLDNINRDRSKLVEQVERIAMSKGLTKEQWQSLIFLALSMGDNVCIMNTVTREYLDEVRKLSTTLESNDHQTVCVLIGAIKEHLKMN